ncbi:MAG: hypothetical protein PHX53_03650 [Syntrophales bacterium]|nr:hypothetical protein [Syntrophales bacterium]
MERYKTSDTIFILGSGSSISSYSQRHWDIIQRHDSIGFNFWPVHDFVPTYYQVELPQASLNRVATVAKILNIKQRDYQNVPIFLKTTHITSSRKDTFFNTLNKDYISRIYVSRMIPIPGLAIETKRKSIELLKRLGYFDASKQCNSVTGWASSVTDLLHIAVKFGYKNIILCGVDLNDSRYFYEVDAKYYEEKGVPVPENIYDQDSKHNVNTGVHLLPESPEWGAVKLQDTLHILNDVVLKPKGINLYVALKSSALFPGFPDYFKLN